MDIRKFGKIFKQINKVPIDYEDDADIKLRGERNYHKKSLDGGYSYTPKLVPIFSWNLSDDVRLTAIKNIDILRKRRPYIFLTTFTSDSVPKYPIVICDKPIDNEELFSIRNKIGAERFVEKFNKTLLHYFKIKIKDAKENNIDNDDVKAYKNNIKKLKEWFWENDVDRDTTEPFIDEDKNQILINLDERDTQEVKKQLTDNRDVEADYKQLKIEHRVAINKVKELSKKVRKSTRKLVDYSDKEFINRCDKYRHLTSGKLNFKKIAEEEFGVHADTVKNEIINRKLRWLIDDSAKYVDDKVGFEQCKVCGKSKIVNKECPHSHPI